MEQYYLWMACVPHMTPARFYRLLTRFGDARAVWENVEDAARTLPEKPAAELRAARSERRFYELFSRLETLGMMAATRIGELYPARLTTICDPPPALFFRGGMRFADEKPFGIVGARNASHDGRRAALEIAQGLAREGVTVVSGLARGVDSAAHQGAVNVGGLTVAVLGCGADVVYPPENGKLVSDILANGGAVVSEYPPGTPPYASNFPARNRIISGLSEGVLMVEGRKNSGAMITMNQALSQGRDVFAVPGSIYAALSEGPNQLIFDGAGPVRSHFDILEALRWGARPSAREEEEALAPMAPDEQAIVDLLKIEGLSFEELLYRTGFNTGALNSLLTILELRGIIKRLPGKMYRA